MTNLYHLYAEFSQLTGKSVARITGFKRLRLLKLGRNIMDEDMTHVGKIASLVYLDVSMTQVTEAGLAQLVKLNNLEKLDVSGRPITPKVIKYVQQLAKLRELFVSGCVSMSEADILSLGRIKTLKVLDVRNTRLGPSTARRLQKLLPDCLIYVPSRY